VIVTITDGDTMEPDLLIQDLKNPKGLYGRRTPQTSEKLYL